MTARMVVDGRDGLEAVPFVEPWSLERERHQHHLRAAPPPRFLLGRLEQLRAKPAVTVRRFNPDLP